MRKALLLLSILGLHCEPAPYQSPNRTTEPPPPKSAFVHLFVGGSPATKVELRLSQKVRAVVPRREISPRLELAAGEYPLSLVGAGQELVTSGLVLLPGSETLLIASSLPRPDGAGSEQRLSALALGGRDPKWARLRLLHAAEGAPPLSLAGPLGELLVDGVASGAVSAYAQLEKSLAIDGKLQLRSPGDPRSLFDVTVTTGLGLGSTTTLMAVGEVGPLATPDESFGLTAFDEASGTVKALPVAPAAGAPDGRIYLFHAAADLGAITAKSSKGPLWGSLAYQQGTPLSALPAGMNTLFIDGATAAVWQGPLKLWPGREWLLLLYGSRMTPKLMALPRPGRAPQTVWRVVNLVEGLAVADLLDGDDEVASKLGYGTATPPQLGDLKRRTLRLRDWQQSSVSWDIEFDQTAVDAAQDQVVTMVLTGSVANRRSVSALLLVESRAAMTLAAPIVPLTTTPSS